MILIIDLCYRKASLSREEFVKPIEQITELNKLEFVSRYYKDVTDDDIKNSSKIILCGTALKDSEYMKHLSYFNWLKETDKTVLGICAGFQTIGAVFGETVVLAKEIGMVKIKKTRTNPLFDSDLEAYTRHHLALTGILNFEVFAESEKCICGIKHNEKNIFGLLFHPEVRNEDILNRFLRL